MLGLENVLIKPLLTEKTSKVTEDFNRYAFVVNIKSNKNQIKSAVEKFFDVKVTNVRTSVLPGKTKRAGKGHKKSSTMKKAYVQLQDGQKIEFFKGI
ncbi:MAG TPA: 50S ribosomal protein L23 [Bacteriovoracaceae bacterium]|nr:50S ribosomal protein L23 [Bacteriovoracaceae bacterium]